LKAQSLAAFSSRLRMNKLYVYRSEERLSLEPELTEAKKRPLGAAGQTGNPMKTNDFYRGGGILFHLDALEQGVHDASIHLVCAERPTHDKL